jgi:hypothetical protein
MSVFRIIHMLYTIAWDLNYKKNIIFWFFLYIRHLNKTVATHGHCTNNNKRLPRPSRPTYSILSYRPTPRRQWPRCPALLPPSLHSIQIPPNRGKKNSRRSRHRETQRRREWSGVGGIAWAARTGGSVRDVVRCGNREVDDDKRKRAATRSTILGGAGTWSPPLPCLDFCSLRIPAPRPRLVSTCLDLARFLPQSYGGLAPPP